MISFGLGKNYILCSHLFSDRCKFTFKVISKSDWLYFFRSITFAPLDFLRNAMCYIDCLYNELYTFKNYKVNIMKV